MSAPSRVRPALNAAVNVTPMIDVMLVLLIIFMIVTPLLRPRATLPRSLHADARPEQPGEIVLDIDRAGAFYLSATGDGAPAALRVPHALSSRTLARWLDALYRHRTLDRVLYLRADSGLDFARIQEAVAIARRAGVRVIGAVTEQSRLRGSPF